MLIKNVDALKLIEGLDITINIVKRAGEIKKLVHYKNVLEACIASAFDRAYTK